MHTITIARLKATLSAELRRVREGESITVLDRTTPVALLSPIPDAIRVARAAHELYLELTPLSSLDPLQYLEDERGESR